MKRQFVKAASAAKMLDSFEAKLAEMKGNNIDSATDVTCGQYIDTDGMFGAPGEIITDDFMQEYWNSQYNEDPSLQEYESFEAWKEDTLPWLKPVDASVNEIDEELEPVNGENYNEDLYEDDTFSSTDIDEMTDDEVTAALIVNEEEVADTIEDIECVPANDPVNAALIIDDEEVADTIEDIECQTIMDGEEVAEPCEGPECDDIESCGDIPVEASHADRYYFGQEAAEKYGDLITSNLSGKTVSKRQDLAEEPGGLIYEAEMLGIDMWDLLEALEGLCYQGRAEEIDDSTYRVN